MLDRLGRHARSAAAGEVTNANIARSARAIGVFMVGLLQAAQLKQCARARTMALREGESASAVRPRARALCYDNAAAQRMAFQS